MTNSHHSPRNGKKIRRDRLTLLFYEGFPGKPPETRMSWGSPERNNIPKCVPNGEGV